MQDIQCHILNYTDAYKKDFLALMAASSAHHDVAYQDNCLTRHNEGDLMIILAYCGGDAVGYVLLNFRPKYTLFHKLGIPEIQDLNVLPLYRRKGIGEMMLHHCENIARTQGYEDLGIGVGLDSSFGAAQRLYARLGYIPDGAGVTYDRQPIEKGAIRAIDDNMSLMMVKAL